MSPSEVAEWLVDGPTGNLGDLYHLRQGRAAVAGPTFMASIVGGAAGNVKRPAGLVVYG